MLVELNTPRTQQGASSLLLECHQRIRKFVDLACRLGEIRDLPGEQIAGAARDVRRYFAEALPLHVQDEEQSILPRLRGRDAGLDDWLEVMSAEHRTHAPLVESLCSTCRAIEMAPTALRNLREKLVATSAALHHEFAVHLQQEEEHVIPFIDTWMSAEEQAEVLNEFRTRRGAASPAPLTKKGDGPCEETPLRHA